MSVRRIQDDLQAAIDDLRRRSLSHLPGDVGRLIYLASTRDYNTGAYYHDGLASAFSEQIAAQALAKCHWEVFSDLVHSPIEKLIHELNTYFESLPADKLELLAAWTKLEPYRVTVPAACDCLSAQLFYSNVKIALAILTYRAAASHAAPDASPRLSLAL
jgi:hypothetical protein